VSSVYLDLSEAIAMVRNGGTRCRYGFLGACAGNVRVSAAITALGGLLFGYDTGVVSRGAAVRQEGLRRALLVPAGNSSPGLLLGRRRDRGALAPGGLSDWIGRRLTRADHGTGCFIVGVACSRRSPPPYPTLLVSAHHHRPWPSGRRRWSCRSNIGEIVPPPAWPRRPWSSLNQLAIHGRHPWLLPDRLTGCPAPGTGG